MQSHANDILNSSFIVNLSCGLRISLSYKTIVVRDQSAWDHFNSFISCFVRGDNIVN